MEVANQELGGFVGACAAVVEKQQEQVVFAGLARFLGFGAARKASISGLSRYVTGCVMPFLNGMRRSSSHQAMCSGLCNATNRAREWIEASR